MTGSRITCVMRPDAMLWPGPGALAAIYRRAIERFEAEKEGTVPGAPDDRKGLKHDPATPSIPS